MSSPLIQHPPRAQRIAVFRALQLGDLLLAVPALRALRAGFPHAEITLIGLPWAEWFVQRFHRYVDRLIAFEGFPGIAEVDYEPERAKHGIRQLRQENFDLVIQLHGSGEISNQFISAIRCPGKLAAGLYRGERPAALTYAAPYPDGEPEIERNLAIMRVLGCPDTGTELELPVLADDEAEIDHLLHGLALDRPMIGLHPGARNPARRWPAERFADVADRLIREHGATVLLTGSASETGLVRRVQNQMHETAIDLSSRTSLGGLTALLRRLDLFISNDTGPAHIARALGIPSVIIWGPAEFRRWAPLDLERHRVVHPSEHGQIDQVEPADVLREAEAQLVKGSVTS